MSTPILTGNGLQVLATSETATWRDEVLAISSILSLCTTPAQNDRIVRAQQKLKSYLDAVEAAREEFKQPFWQACLDVDALAKELTEEAAGEMTRLSRLAGDWLALERDRAKASNAARNRDLTDLERDRAAAISRAQTPQEMDRIQEEFSAKAAALPIAAPEKAQSQVGRSDWEIAVFDALALAKCNAACVTITPKLMEIKACLNAGVKLDGVTATRKTTATVRRGRKPKEQGELI